MMRKKSDNSRHILALSGGKDSAALAVYLKDKIPDLEYVFLDTGHELPETYEYLDRIRAVLGINITRIKSKRSFEYWLRIKNYFLPSPRQRWCTEVLKIKPYEEYIGNEKTVSYVGLRWDEDRMGYISGKQNVIPRYPFMEDELVLDDIIRILEESGIGLPSYYNWRSRSGCYFCFFQQKIEWLNLSKQHKDLFYKAMAFEKMDPITGKRFTWNDNESLEELLNRENEIVAYNDKNARANLSKTKGSSKLVDVLGKAEYQPCIVCTV